MPFQSQKKPLELSEAHKKQLQRAARSRTESLQRVERARILLAYARGKQFPPLPECWAPTGKRSIAASTKLCNWELRRHSATCPAGGENGSSGAQHELGWCRWPAARPKSSVMRRNCGPPIFWPNMPAAKTLSQWSPAFPKRTPSSFSRRLYHLCEVGGGRL